MCFGLKFGLLSAIGITEWNSNFVYKVIIVKRKFNPPVSFWKPQPVVVSWKKGTIGCWRGVEEETSFPSQRFFRRLMLCGWNSLHPFCYRAAQIMLCWVNLYKDAQWHLAHSIQSVHDRESIYKYVITKLFGLSRIISIQLLFDYYLCICVCANGETNKQKSEKRLNIY